MRGARSTTTTTTTMVTMPMPMRAARRGMTTTTTTVTRASWYDETKEDDSAASTSTSSSPASSSAGEEEREKTPPASATTSAEPKFAYEPKSKSKRKKNTVRRAKVEVQSAAVDAAKGTGVKTLSQETEEAYVKFLFLYVNVIFVFGVTLGLSAFKILPDAADVFIAEKMYPFFTPFVGGFLLFSSIYGVIKTRDDPNAT